MKNKKIIIIIVAIVVVLAGLCTVLFVNSNKAKENQTMNAIASQAVGETTKETKLYFKADSSDKVLTSLAEGAKFSILSNEKEYTDSNNNVYYMASYKDENGKNYIGYVLKEDVKKLEAKANTIKDTPLYFKADKKNKVLVTIPEGSEIIYMSRLNEYKDSENNEYYMASYKDENEKSYIGYVLREDVEPKEEEQQEEEQSKEEEAKEEEQNKEEPKKNEENNNISTTQTDSQKVPPTLEITLYYPDGKVYTSGTTTTQGIKTTFKASGGTGKLKLYRFLEGEWQEVKLGIALNQYHVTYSEVQKKTYKYKVCDAEGSCSSEQSFVLHIVAKPTLKINLAYPDKTEYISGTLTTKNITATFEASDGAGTLKLYRYLDDE